MSVQRDSLLPVPDFWFTASGNARNSEPSSVSVSCVQEGSQLSVEWWVSSGLEQTSEGPHSEHLLKADYFQC